VKRLPGTPVQISRPTLSSSGAPGVRGALFIRMSDHPMWLMWGGRLPGTVVE
jgi:hypothetical protein